jgi:hypothetical protein
MPSNVFQRTYPHDLCKRRLAYVHALPRINQVRKLANLKVQLVDTFESFKTQFGIGCAVSPAKNTLDASVVS